MKQIQKNSWIYLFLFLMLIMGNSVKVSADQKTMPKTMVVENPMYDEVDVRTYSEPRNDSRASVVTVYSRKEAAEYLREQMRRRNSTVTIKIYQSYSSSLVTGILDDAKSYSDELASDEGDYLRANFKGASISTSQSGSMYITITYTLRYLSTASQESLVNDEVRRVLDQLNVYDADEYTKIKAVHDWIVANVKYDYSLSRHSTYDAIVTKKVVCQGFASLSYRLLKELNVGVRYITGYGNGGLHAWNVVSINGKWYNIDNTWDQNNTVNATSYRYFLLNEQDFVRHSRDYEYRTMSFYADYPMTDKSYQAITSIGLNHSQLYLADGANRTLEPVIYPTTATNKKVVWSSSNTTVAVVDANGKVTMVGNGTATIRATTVEGAKVASCNVMRVIPVQSIALNQSQLSLKKGDTNRLVAQVSPNTATITDVTYSSSNTAVATVDQSGVVKAIGGGTAIITVYSKEGNKQTTCTVSVPTAADSVQLDKRSMLLENGNVANVTATVNPSNATDKRVRFESSNSKVATVDQNGKVTGVGVGTATIHVITEDGQKSATCTVTVQISVTKVTGNKTSIKLVKGKSATLKATVAPTNATNVAILYSSSNNKVAKVSNKGKVTAIGAGSAVITIKAGGKSTTCKVTVSSPVKKIKINAKKITVNKGSTYKLKVTFTPSDASNKKLKFKSKNTKIAKVNNVGKITAVKVGTTQISVTTVDGKKKAQCRVTVKDPSVAAKKAYQKYIKKNKNRNDAKRVSVYSYLDMDQDGVPELIVMNETDYLVYTYKKEKMILLGEAGSCYDGWFFRYNKQNKTIVVGGGDAGGPLIDIYKINKNKLILVNGNYRIDTFNSYTGTVAPKSEWKYYYKSTRLWGASLTKMKREISGKEVKFTKAK